jgi:hypothetical protein
MSVNLPKRVNPERRVRRPYITIMSIFMITVFDVVITILIPWIPHFDRVKRCAVSLLLLLAHLSSEGDRLKTTPLKPIASEMPTSRSSQSEVAPSRS